MQRREPKGIVISCDFCGDDWDQVKPMIEGHQGAVLCLECFKRAFDAMPAGEVGSVFKCTVCLREQGPDMPRWAPAERPASANQEAWICADCVTLAAKTFHKDPDVPWHLPRRP
jgi:hypothetical protein